MLRFAFNLALALGLIAVVALTWLGQQSTPDPYLQSILSSRTLRVGMDPTYPPFDTVQNGQVGGYDAKLASAIASDLGVKVQYKTLALDSLFDALVSGNIDVIISAQPPIPERQGDARYSSPYYQSGQVLVVRQGEQAIGSTAGLAGKRVGVELGSNADTEARRLQRTNISSMQLMSVYRSPQEALDALVHGGVEATITDNTSAQQYMAEHPDSIKVLSPPLTDEPFVVAMPTKADSLSAHIDATIQRLQVSGELAKMMGLAGR